MNENFRVYSFISASIPTHPFKRISRYLKVQKHVNKHCRDYTAQCLFVCLFVCFVVLHPKSTAMVIAGRSVHLTTLFPGQA